MSFIDLHCHTMQTKAGDGKKRNVTKDKFVSSLVKSNVSVVAITNHNYFDKDQYLDFKNNDADILVLPGIELDVTRLNNDVGHCVMVSNPNNISPFLDFVRTESLFDKTKAEDYKLSIKELVSKTKDIDGLFIIHYNGKTPSFSEEDYQFLKESLVGNRLFLEPSNLTSAFVYMRAGYKCLIGSDIKDWDNYPGKPLPELKIQISSFDSLKLLLKKDANAIKKHLEDNLYSANFEINDPDIPEIKFKLPIYRDVNIIIGGKSTGKSLILKAISETLKKEGKANQTKIYQASEVPAEFEKIKNYVPIEKNILDHTDNDNYSAEISRIQNFKISLPDNIFQKIDEFLKSKKKMQMAKKLGFISTTTKFTADIYSYEEKLKELKADRKHLLDFRDSKLTEKYLSKEDQEQIEVFLSLIDSEIRKQINALHISYYSQYLAEETIQNFKTLFEKVKGTSAMPSSIGFYKFFQTVQLANRDLQRLRSILKSSFKKEEYLGYIEGKGNVKLSEQIDFEGSKKDGSKENWKNISKIKISEARKFQNDINKCISSFGTSDFIRNVPIVGKFLRERQVRSIFDLCFYRSVFLKENGTCFEPSSGDKTSLVLANILNSNSNDTEFYLLDEPEMSVGHNYVTEKIIPRLKELARLKKVIIIVTHDANIAVCTLPYQTIYRIENSDGYQTYIGNVFQNELTNIHNPSDVLKWKETAVNVLEGGAEVFSLRGETYGKALQS